MRRLSRRHKLSLALILPLFAGCYVITLAQHLTGRLGFVHLTVHGAPSPDEYPRVRTFLDDRVARESGLRPGDVLLEAGGRSLRGSGPYSFYAITAASVLRPVPISFERAGVRMQALLDVSPLSPQREISYLVYALLLVLVGTLVLVRAPQDHRSYLLFLVATIGAIGRLRYPGGQPAFTYAWFITYSGALVNGPLALVTAMRWLRRPIHRWEWVVPTLLLLMPAVDHASRTGVGMPPVPARMAFLALETLQGLVGLGYAGHIFYTADALERRRVKWVVYGLFLGTLPTALVDVLIIHDESWEPARVYAHHGNFLIPLAFFFAIVRYDLFDIDRLISASAALTIVGIALLGGMLAVVPLLAQTASSTLGIDPEAGRVALSMSLAAVLVPVYRTLHPWLDQRVFAERHRLAQRFERLRSELGACRGVEEMATRAGEGFDALLRPESIAIYGRAGEAFTPLFVRGSALPPAFEVDSTLVQVLEAKGAPLFARAKQIGPFERAALETLGAEVVVPQLREQQLVAFTCLGGKKSGDIYTASDLALLAAVAERCAEVIARIDLETLARESQAMQSALRRYVPGAVADRVLAGDALEPAEREVSVLFVDIRDYTRVTAGLRPADVFATLNEHTERVSRIVQESGGTIVEFNGDGMMAVFGAPEALARKEQHAAEAARRIVDSMPATLAVGVGIATGAAFVGSIRSTDRLIWSAVGSTTNLASRLQSMTRELGASIALDETTRERAGYVCADFVRHAEVAIRGRSGRLDVFALPLLESG